jgi:hypothetical protein
MLLPILAGAQQDLPPDSTVQEEYESESDTSYSVSETVPDTVIFRSTPDTAIARLQGLKEFAYANDPAYWKREQERPLQRPGWALMFLSNAFQYLLFGLFITALIYLLFKILTENKILLFKRNKKFTADVLGQETLEQEDISNLIAEAEQGGNFRMASRYRYLQLLQEMDSRQLIRTHAELTNWDYVKQLGAHPLSAKFRYLTSAYEYIWYGEFELSSDQYGFLRKKFETFLN